MAERDACMIMRQPDGAVFRYVERPDGGKIRYGYWPARGGSTKGSVMVFPGRSEFIEKYNEVIADLLARGFAVACIDWRNQGLSARPLPNRHKHYIEDFATMLDDMDGVWDDLMTLDLPEPWHLVAHSMGGHMGLRYLHRHPTRFKKAMMTSPMVGINYGGIPGPLARFFARVFTRIGLGTSYAVGQWNYGPVTRSKTVMNLITSDEVRFTCEHDLVDINPDLALGGVTWGWLNAARKSIATLSGDGYPEAITTPLYIFQAGREKLVDNTMMTALVKRLPDARFEVVEGALHEILSEQDQYRDRFWQVFDDFIG